MTEIDEFVQSLTRFVRTAAEETDDVMYSRRGVRIADARNHLFIGLDDAQTDESEDIFALRDLCRVDEDTMETVPDEQRMYGIARMYWQNIY